MRSIQLLICALALTACYNAGDTDVPEEVESTRDDLYYASTKLWPTNFISVCWESPSTGAAADRGWVQDQVHKTWEAASGVQFTGWGACSAGSKGIRIRVSDERPHTTALGKNLDGVSGGMVLNFTYLNWSSSGCASSHEFCTRAIAAHEFGHALGFAHEQNRTDTPATCVDAPQGENGDATLGAWDTNSIMNYCNPSWNNGGVLSATDIQGVSLLYGLPQYHPTFVLANYGYNAGSWRVEKHLRVLADVNHDGRADIVAFGDDGAYVSLATGSGFAAPVLGVADYAYNNGWRVEKHPRFLADVNNDGRADVVGFGDGGTYVSLSTGSGFTAPALWVADYGYNFGWRVESHPRFLADVNNDGRADVVGFANGGTYVSLSTGSSFTAPARWVADYGYNNGWRVESHPRFLADVNNDHRADVVGFGDGGTYVSLSTGSGFTAPARWSVDYGYSAGGWRVEKHPRLLADVNNDGRADIVGFAEAGTYVSLSTGSGFTAASLWVADFGYTAGSWRVEKHARFLADMNNDGRADIVGFGDNGLSVSLAQSGSFSAPVLRTRNFGYLANWTLDKHPRFVADVNNDGRADMVGFGDDGVWLETQ